MPLTLRIPVTTLATLTPYVRDALDWARELASSVDVHRDGPGATIVGSVSDVSRAAMVPFLEAGTRINEELRKLRRFAPLYASGVPYEVEPPGREDWNTSDVLRAVRRGIDCEDLAMDRAAELRAAGERGARADTYVSRERPDGSRVWHAIVRRADGTIEDPSAHLGMRVRRGHLGDGTPFRSALAESVGARSRHWALVHRRR